MPELNLPVRTRRCTLWLPPGYEIVGANEASLASRFLSLWKPRFGPQHEPDRMHEFIEPGAEGWTRFEVDLSAAEPVRLNFVRTASLQLLGTVVLLLTAAATCWKLASRPLVVALLAVAFAAATLAVPAGYAPIASGAMLGAVFFLLWWLLNRRLAPSAADRSAAHAPAARPASGSTLARTVRLSLMLAALLATLQARPAWAATGRDLAAPGDIRDTLGVPVVADLQRGTVPASVPPIYRVLVPIDATKKPTGGKVHVPEALYHELYRRGAATEEPHGYLILDATYQGVLAADNSSGRLSVDLLRAGFDVEAFGVTQVRIPLGGQGASVIAGSFLLDGRPVTPTTKPDVAALTVDVSAPGRYHLEASLRPTENNWPAAAGFSIAIPRVAQSRLDLTLPLNTAAGAFSGPLPVEVPSACGAVRIEGEPARLLADLGPAQQLTVRWHGPGVRAASTPVFDVDQLLWVKIQPGSVVLATKWKIHVAEGVLQKLHVSVDPRLRLLPLAGESPPSVVLARESGDSRLFAFYWAQPVADQTDLEATFLLSGATGVGTFHLPSIELPDARSTTRWMAVSVDPTLDREEQRRDLLEGIPSGEFLRAWQAGGPDAAGRTDWSDARPMAAYCLPPGDIGWNISTRPQEPHSAAQSHFSLGYDVDHVDVVYEAHVSTDSGYLFQYRLAGPKDLRIDDISLLEEDINRVSRWSQDASGGITVFLNGAASGEQKFVLHGRLPCAAGQASPMPRLRLEGCTLRSTTVHIFRRPTVLVAVTGDQHPLKTLPMPDEMTETALGRFVEAFSYEGPQAPAVTTRTSIAAQPPQTPR